MKFDNFASFEKLNRIIQIPWFWKSAIKNLDYLFLLMLHPVIELPTIGPIKRLLCSVSQIFWWEYKNYIESSFWVRKRKFLACIGHNLKNSFGNTAPTLHCLGVFHPILRMNFERPKIGTFFVLFSSKNSAKHLLGLCERWHEKESTKKSHLKTISAIRKILSDCH